jgi:hypothetical protein
MRVVSIAGVDIPMLESVSEAPAPLAERVVDESRWTYLCPWVVFQESAP